MNVPPSIYLTGNDQIAVSLKSRALQFYRFITNQADIGGLSYVSRSLPLEDGSLIKITSFKEGNYGLRTGHIIIIGAGGNLVSERNIYVCVYNKYATINSLGFLGETYFISNKELKTPIQTFPLLLPIVSSVKQDYNIGTITTLTDKELPISQGAITKHSRYWLDKSMSKIITWKGTKLYSNGSEYTVVGIVGAIHAAVISSKGTVLLAVVSGLDLSITIKILEVALYTINKTAIIINTVSITPVHHYNSEPICFEFSEDASFLSIFNIIDPNNPPYLSKKRYTIYRLTIDLVQTSLSYLFLNPTISTTKVVDWDIVDTVNISSTTTGAPDAPIQFYNSITYTETIEPSTLIDNSIDLLSFPKLHSNKLYGYGFVTKYVTSSVIGSYVATGGALLESIVSEYTTKLLPDLSEIVIDMFTGSITITSSNIPFKDIRVGLSYNRKADSTYIESFGDAVVNGGGGYSYLSNAKVYSVYFSDPYYKLLVLAIKDISTDKDYTITSETQYFTRSELDALGFTSAPENTYQIEPGNISTKEHLVYNIYNNNILTSFSDIHGVEPTTTYSPILNSLDPITISNAQTFGGVYPHSSSFNLHVGTTLYTQYDLDQYTNGLCSVVTDKNIVVCIRDYIDDYTVPTTNKTFLKKTLVFSLKDRAATLTEIIDADIRELDTPYNTDLQISPITIEINK